MSTSEPSTPAVIRDAVSGPASTVASSLVEPLRATAFWSAVVLPFAYLPLLATGAAWDRPLAFGVLLLLNAVAFLAGHGYDPETA